VRPSTASNNWLPRRPLGCLQALTLTGWVLASGASLPLAAGQGLEALDSQAVAPIDPLLGEAPSGQLLLDAETVAPAASFGAYGDDADFETGGPPLVRPVNWIAGPYLRGGVNFVIGEGIFDEQQDVGYGISGGFRQPLGPEIGGDRFFFDLGGSYQSSYGKAMPVPFAGLKTITERNLALPTLPPDVEFEPVTNAFQTTLEELRRGSVHAAIGWFWGAGMDNSSGDPQLRFATRIGGRVGHARGGFTEDQLIFPDPPDLTGNILTTEVIDRTYYPKTDTYGGLFVGTEAILLQRQYSFGHFQWTLDGELANDWINIGNVWKDSLGTASVMMGFMLSR
jgi:hypothetical protein